MFRMGPSQMAKVARASFVLLLAALLSSATSSARAEAPATAVTCNLHQLRASLAKSSGATAGHVRVDVYLTNRSRTSCSVRGYPNVRLFDHRGRPLHEAIHRGADPMRARASGPTEVPLRPGQHAVVALTFIYLERSCATSAAVAVRPPGVRDYLVVRLGIKPCGTLRFTAFAGSDKALNPPFSG